MESNSELCGGFRNCWSWLITQCQRDPIPRAYVLVPKSVGKGGRRASSTCNIRGQSCPQGIPAGAGWAVRQQTCADRTGDNGGFASPAFHKTTCLLFRWSPSHLLKDCLPKPWLLLLKTHCFLIFYQCRTQLPCWASFCGLVWSFLLKCVWSETIPQA